ncbi:YoaK family protein [Streptomyces sp. NRRL B-1347]|uniref:YoaK family protein n=1 Tax=Streptomyces sp. NRRL B-1347 TaxID=1476877 RepID=UPI00068F6042|nr:YoaK family protein [Streptomyces sp. NRRL B-1347]
MTTHQPPGEGAGRGGEVPAAQVGDTHPLSLTLVALTVVSGFVDAISYLGLGRVFAANMTGNVLVIGFAAGGAPGFSVAGSLVSLGAFLAGAVGAGRLARAFRGRRRAAWVRTALCGEAMLQGAATAVAFTGGAHRTQLLIALLALAMGLRNGTVRTLGVPDMTTTVLTQTLTGLASQSRLAGGSDPRAVRRLTAVVAMVAGALPGAWLVVRHGIAWPLLVSTAIVAVTAVAYREKPEAAARKPKFRTGP